MRIQTRKQLIDECAKITYCTPRVINIVGPYAVREIYSYFIEALKADKKSIDRYLVDGDESDIFCQRKRDAILCRILNGMIRDYEECNDKDKSSPKPKVSVESYLRKHVNKNIYDYIDELNRNV